MQTSLRDRWMLGLYGGLIAVTAFLLPVVALFNARVRSWWEGRRKGWGSPSPEGRTVIWMHCASLGEFEQGRPVWEGLRVSLPDAWLVLTFFSRSGYDRMKSHPGSDRVCLLPLDTRANARRWMDEVRPDLVLWVKYDFWFHYWREAGCRGIPLLLFAARFRPGHFLSRSWAAPFRRVVLGASVISVQDEESCHMLETWGRREVLMAGDPRIDRVLAIVAEGYANDRIEDFRGHHRVIIAGSVWEADLDRLLPLIRSGSMPGWRWIVAPHELDEARILRIVHDCGRPAIRYSALPEDDGSSEAEVLVLDTIGMLSRVYRYADIVYVGGGFGRSVHNLLEPAAWSVPVLFGPRHEKFPEADGLIRADGGYEVGDTADLASRFVFLGDGPSRERAGHKARKWLDDHAGATPLILAECQRLLHE